MRCRDAQKARGNGISPPRPKVMATTTVHVLNNSGHGMAVSDSRGVWSISVDQEMDFQVDTAAPKIKWSVVTSAPLDAQGHTATGTAFTDVLPTADGPFGPGGALSWASGSPPKVTVSVFPADTRMKPSVVSPPAAAPGEATSDPADGPAWGPGVWPGWVFPTTCRFGNSMITESAAVVVDGAQPAVTVAPNTDVDVPCPKVGIQVTLGTTSLSLPAITAKDDGHMVLDEGPYTLAGGPDVPGTYQFKIGATKEAGGSYLPGPPPGSHVVEILNLTPGSVAVERAQSEALTPNSAEEAPAATFALAGQGDSRRIVVFDDTTLKLALGDDVLTATGAQVGGLPVGGQASLSSTPGVYAIATNQGTGIYKVLVGRGTPITVINSTPKVAGLSIDGGQEVPIEGGQQYSLFLTGDGLKGVIKWHIICQNLQVSNFALTPVPAFTPTPTKFGPEGALTAFTDANGRNTIVMSPLPNPPPPELEWWMWLLIAVGCLIVLGIIGVVIYIEVRKKSTPEM